jgi:putative endonuclease
MYYVYIVTNKPRGTLYIGVTNDLIRRVYEHKNGMLDGFTKKYCLKMLVYYEFFDDILFAIQRKKTIKHWIREWKITLIESNNPLWQDLYIELS